MELTNDFRVDVPVEQAWAVLTDVERVAPCMPGAELQEIEGDEYRGVVKVKVGPITAQYKGKAHFLEKDEAGRRLVLKAEGRETRGQGNANAVITATLAADGDGTQVSVVTDLNVTGKVAQFGRGVLADVSAKLLNQFVDCLHNDVLAADHPTPPPEGDWQSAEEAAASNNNGQVSGASAGAAGAGASGSGGGGGGGVSTATSTATSVEDKATVRKIESAPAAPVDLLQTAGSPVAKRAAPAVAVLFLLYWLFRRRRKARRG